MSDAEKFDLNDPNVGEVGRLAFRLMETYDLHARESPAAWRVWGKDTFDYTDYPIGVFASAWEAIVCCYARLRELDNGGRDGGQLRGGIQDRIFLIPPGGGTIRILPMWHPIPTFLSDRSVTHPHGAVLREEDARAAIEFFARSQWCVILEGRAWILLEEAPAAEGSQPSVERAPNLDFVLPKCERAPGEIFAKEYVTQNAEHARAALDRAFRAWNESPGAGSATLCFQLIARDDVPLREESEAHDGESQRA